MRRLIDQLREGLRWAFWPPQRIAGVLVVAGLLWRVARWAAGFPFWGDESFIAVNFYTRDFGDMVGTLDHAQVVPLGFLWVTLALSKVLGSSEQVLRLLPTLAGVSALLLMWRWAPRALPRRGAYLGVAIFAASYYPVRHANEVKPYALDLFIALGLTVLAWRVWQRVRCPWRWAAMASASALSIWFSYPSAFVSVGLLLALLGKAVTDSQARRSGVVWAGGLLSALLLVLSAFWMWTSVGAGQSQDNESLRTSGHWSLAFPPGAGDTPMQWLLWPVRFGGWFFEVHTGNMLAYPVGGKNAASAVTFVLVVAGCIALWRRRHPLLALLLMPACASFVAAAFRLYPYGSSARTTLFLAPAICLLAGVGGVALAQRLLAPREAVRSLRFAALVLLLIVIGGAVRDVREPYKSVSDLRCRALVRDLAEEAQPGERWVFVGAMHDTPWAPNMVGWGGDAARSRLYFLLEAKKHGIPIDFAPDPAALPRVTGRTVLIVFRENHAGEIEPFPAEQIARYRSDAAHAMGDLIRVDDYAGGKGGSHFWFYFYAAAPPQ